MAGVRDIRALVEEARAENRPTVVFLDEIHRFNKAQQDALLPHVEDGTLILIGATTENPSFELNNALLSRVRVYVFRPLSDEELAGLLDGALERLAADGQAIRIDPPARRLMLAAADGDARRLIGLVEMAAQLAGASGERIGEDVARAAVGDCWRRFDNRGDDFYDQFSALHKSIRGSDPDASLYWLARMLDGGCDPLYVARRLVRVASEDIGLADPRALTLSLDAAAAYERLGSPEGELAVAQAVVYLACAPKSNAVYTAMDAAAADVRAHGSLPVPLHLRNAPTALMRRLGHSHGYRYPHDEPGGYAAGVDYLPEGLSGRRYYEPRDAGLEVRIRERLESLRGRGR
jgi:putative ATPase